MIKSNPELYLAQLENIYKAKWTTSQKEKFANVVSLLPNDIARNVRELIIKPLSKNPFKVLEKEIVSWTSMSEQKKIVQILSKETLGECKPSQFLRRLKELAGNYDDDDIICHIFLSWLPEMW